MGEQMKSPVLVITDTYGLSKALRHPVSLPVTSALPLRGKAGPGLEVLEMNELRSVGRHGRGGEQG
jgi:hypothetical protein